MRESVPSQPQLDSFSFSQTRPPVSFCVAVQALNFFALTAARVREPAEDLASLARAELEGLCKV